MADAQEKSKAQPAAAEGASILDEIMVQTKLKPSDEGYDVAKKGVQAFIAQLLTAGGGQKADKKVVDNMLAEIDQKLSRQLDAILHHEAFQKLESAWRGLRFMVDNTEFRENVRLHVVNCSKDDLLTDFEDSPEIVKSGLYRTVYTGEYGQFGGEPYGAMIANYSFGPGPQDIALLQKVASVATNDMNFSMSLLVFAHSPSAANRAFLCSSTFAEGAQPTMATRATTKTNTRI